MAMTKSLSRKLYELLKSEFPNSSENLAKFAKKRDYMKNHNRILKDSDGELYIGINDDGWLTGAKLMRIACGDFQTWAFASKETSSCEDVTEWFISEYSEKGMCAYTDMRHSWIQGVHDKDLKDGEVRTCEYCGKTEVLHSEMVRKIWWQ